MEGQINVLHSDTTQ